MTDHATPLQVTEVQSSLPHVHKHILIGCQFTFEITDGLSWTLLRWDHTRMYFVLLCTWQNALCTCVLYRMQWVLLCTPLASLMYFDVHRINIWEPQCKRNVSSYEQIGLAGFMSPCVYESMQFESNYQNNRKIHFTLQLFCLNSRTEFIFGKEVPWDNRHQDIPHCYGNSVIMATRVKPQ